MSSLTKKGARVVDPARAPTLAQNLGSEKRVIKGDARKFPAAPRTKPVRDGVFRGRDGQRPAVLGSHVCGGGVLNLEYLTHSPPRFSVSQSTDLQTVARSVTDRTPLPTGSFVARSRKGPRPVLPEANLRFDGGCDFATFAPDGTCGVRGQRCAKRRTALGIG